MTKHVLIIDDSLTETRIFKVLLEKNGFEVSVACNGQEGIDVARATQPDLILMDVVMPLLNGFQATRELTKNQITAHIPIIVCSSKSARTDRLWALKQGAKEYLVKPVKVRELLEVISRLLAEGNQYEQSL
ncbi:MAG: Two-component system response regulator [uncultured Thiotrichaceae bacterium]|uniref:Two-component system response regulator n=1 Tax=uncultured Thiotrichaceae bacterium TaxID=298394 RepID=A0A6S6UBX1_9GAMM|nr:MAG: Two-component system response regulator [uncultured Thiotrichaceae bacterium]